MFQKVLIANRGEIALRVIRACRELGVATVAVYSSADEASLHVAYADEAVCVGPPPAAQSYLVMQNLIMAAVTHGADAIHPGYGFLAESAAFSRLCADNDLTFIGPGPESIELMGDKAMARATMTAAGVPVTPGSDGSGGRRRRRRRGRAGRGPAGHGQGVGRGRRQGHPHRARRGCPCRRRAPGQRRGPGRLRRRRRLRREVHRQVRATSRSRSSPTARATPSTWASATAPSSAATRS